MKLKSFVTTHGTQLIVVSDGKQFYFYTDDETTAQIDFIYPFDNGEFESLYYYLLNTSKLIWKTFEPKEAYSASSDYDEYYDKELDNNGYFAMHNMSFSISRPTPDDNRLYIFNRQKMQSFVYDIRKVLSTDEH